MPQLVDPSTGQLHDVADADAAGAIAAGWHPQTIGESDVASTAAANQLNYGGVSGGIKAGLAGLARGATLGGSDVAARILGGEDTAKTLAGLQAQNPITSGVSEFAGALAPSVVSGGAATPAGMVSKLGQGVTRGLTREGAGLIERTAVHSAAAAAEGSLYGGGQYLSQIALEDKPISAEGFVGGMGRGALFAAPIGGGFSLAGEALLRARSLFPKSQITPEAAAAIKSDASAALHESIADADAMAQTARQKIAEADVQAGAAGARTQVTRAVFGGGDPAAIDAAAGANVNKEQLTAALSKLEASQVALKEWIASGGDDELADIALSAKRPVTPGVPVGEFGAPGARGYKPGEVAAPGPPSQAPLVGAAEGTPVTRMLRKGAPAVEDIGAAPAMAPAAEPGASAPSLADIRPAGEAPATSVGKRAPAAPTTPFDFKDSGLAFDPETRSYFNGEAPGSEFAPQITKSTVRPVEATAAKAAEPLSEAEFAAFKKSYGNAAESHLPAEMHYSKGGDEIVNPELRSGQPLSEQGQKLYDGLMDAYKLPESRLKRDVEVYRGLSDRSGTAIRDRFADVKPGDMLDDPAFMSTSYYAGGGSRGDHVVFLIHAPAGSPALPIRSKFANEGELLFPPHSKLRVDSVEMVPVGERWHLKHGQTKEAFANEMGGMEILPDGTTVFGTGAKQTSHPPLKEIRATLVDAPAPAVGVTRSAPVDLSAPIDKLSVRQIKEYQDAIDKALETASGAQKEELYRKWDEAVARRNALRDTPASAPDKSYVMPGSALPEAGSGADDLLSQLQGTKSKLDAGESLVEMGAPTRAAYKATKAEKTAAAAEHFRAKYRAARDGAAAEPETDLLAALRGTKEQLGAGQSLREIGGAPMVSDQVGTRGPALEDIRPAAPEAKTPSDTTRLREMIGGLSSGDSMPVSAAEYSARREAMGFSSATAKKNIGRAADNDAIEALLQKRPGKNVDIEPAIARAAKVIGDHEAASAEVADLLGADAPKTAVEKSQALAAARRAQADAQGASAAKAAQGINDRGISGLGDRTVVEPGIRERMNALRGSGNADKTVVDGTIGAGLGDKTVVDPGIRSQMDAMRPPAVAPGAGAAAARKGGIGGKLADVGTALEVMKALGVHVPALSAIPVIGPVLGLFLKARAVLGILGRKGGSVGRDVDGLIAAASAATRDRIAKATQAILTGAGKGALKISEAADGPSVTLSYKLFPGDGITKSKDPQKLYQARMDEIARAQQPNAIDHAIADRYQTSDPALHDAIVGQVQRGISFLDSKAPKPTILQTMLPSDGTWKPSKAQLDEFGKYVHAVGDPASVLEDLAKGHVTLEGAETLRVVYPELFAEAQRMLMQSAPTMQKTLPYPTRVAISILYRVPVDNSMAPGHLQYLQAPTSGAQPATPGGSPAGAPMPPAITGPLQLGQSTMTALDRRAGA